MFRQILHLILFGLFLSACLNCAGSSSSGSDSQDFSVSPGALTFSAQIDEGAPAPQNITAVANGSAVQDPDIIYTYDVIDDCRIEYPAADTIVVAVTVKPPVMLGVGTHSTTVTLDNGTYCRVIPVTYTITDIPPGDPLVRYVAPYTVMAGRTNEVVIRGSGFKRFNSTNTPAVSFGGFNGSDIAVISDTEMLVTAPALPVGTYAVNVAGSATTFTSTADLAVIGPQIFETTDIATLGDKSRMIFDSRRNALYIVNTTLDQIERYTHQSGTSWTLATLSIPGLKDAGLSPDGEVLIAVDGTNFCEIDPVGLSLVKPPISAPLAIYDNLASVVIVNDGKAVAVGDNQWSGIYVYDLIEQHVFRKTHLNSSYIEVGYQIYAPKAYPLPDGSGLYLGEIGITTTRLYFYDATDGSVVETGLVNSALGFFSQDCNRDKSLFIINGQDLYDAELNLMATLPQAHPVAAMNPDGDMIYACDLTNSILRAFDVSDPSAPVQVGADANLSSPAGLGPQMVISPDGNTLFITGSKSLHVIDLTSFVF